MTASVELQCGRNSLLDERIPRGNKDRQMKCRRSGKATKKPWFYRDPRRIVDPLSPSSILIQLDIEGWFQC